MGKMLSRRQMQHLCICLALGLLLCSLWQAAAWGRTQLHTGDAVCADTLRLHIRAASDAVADQSAKLRVRDAVLTCLDAACPAGNQTDARSWAARNLFTLQLAARHALARCGVNAPVQVQLVNMYFPARQYTGGCLPAGRYDAVRITIGSGSGQNWWCVMYPNMCFSDSMYEVVDKEAGEKLREVLTTEEYEKVLAEGDYQVRMKYFSWLNPYLEKLAEN